MLTQKYLKECLNYNSETGAFTWKERPISHFKNKKTSMIVNSRLAGKPAGVKDKLQSSNSEYLRIKINDRKYQTSRLAWLYVNGEDPICIDHINGNSLDNKIKNLRNVTQFENTRNMKMYNTNKSGFTGVSRCKKTGNWIASINIEKKTKRIGTFKNIEDAAKARKEAEKTYGYHENHGRIVSDQ